tara:strand:+ start:721 stop:1110 length:390 start_codon:yes stop_codon:yes gene_type:complete
MKISTPISTGELLDKLSITQIKLKNIKDKEKLCLISLEEDALKETVENSLSSYDNKDERLSELLGVNEKLWIIEDAIRSKEKNKEFDEEFIELARAVYYTNDERFVIKNKINNETGSLIQEQKSYEEYQ